jgi:hypothetical protein
LTCALIAGCGPEIGDLEDEEATTSEELSTCDRSHGVKVAQVNICEGGKWQSCSTDRRLTYGTQAELADRMRSASLSGIAVIGVQEIVASDAERLRGALSRATGVEWRHEHTSMGLNAASSGLAIYFRSDRIRLVEDFGYVTVERIAYPDPNHALYDLRFMGVLLEEISSARTFGMFTGKTAWGGLTTSRDRIDNARRGVEASRLKRWIREKMAPHPTSTSILAIDTTPEGTESWSVLGEKFYDGNPTYGGTHPADRPTRRYDQLFWDYDSGPRRSCGFIDGPRRSSPFGSDHRFVWATVAIR